MRTSSFLFFVNLIFCRVLQVLLVHEHGATIYEAQPEKLTIRCVVVLIETQHLSKVCRLHFKTHTLYTIQYTYTISLYHSADHTTLSFFCTKLWPAILSNDSSSGAWQWRWHIPTDRTSSTLPSPISVNDSAHYRVNGETHCRRLRCDKRYSSSRQKVSTALTSCPCLLIQKN